jgi:molybdopterin-guanine dinucleotide biosynthesis protein A
MLHSNQGPGNLIGVVLSGGLSSRMGRDKGLMVKNNLTWSEIAFNNLAALQIPVYVSVNEFQIPAYKKIFSFNNLIVDDNDLNGPLKGLISVHKQFPDKDLIVLASDMTDMDIQLLKELRLSYQQQRGFDYYIYTNETEPEPLCGVYSSQALDRIWKTHQSKKLPKHSMKYILSLGTISSSPVPSESKAYFANYNYIDH